MSDKPGDRGERSLRWHALLRDAAEPLFLLSRGRRLSYANPAWERLTGLTFSEVRGQSCRRRSRSAERADQVLAALAPPPEALAGQPCTVRRRAPGRHAVVWWDVSYFPWLGTDGPPAILGKIQSLETRAAAHATLPEKLMQLRQRVHQEYRLENLPCDSAAMRRVAAQIRLAAGTATPVWLQGPPGAGKEWIARTIHQMSPRREQYFAVVRAGSLPPDQIAALLHEAAGRWHIGALYIAEPRRLPRELQSRLAQLLDNETEGPRIFAGASTPPAADVEQGCLLTELHCGVSALVIETPALAARLEDLPRLVDRLLPRVAQALDKPVQGMAPAALELLRRHAWPGNITELYEALFTAGARAAGPRLDVEDLPFYLQQTAAPALPALPLDELLAKVERRLIELALRVAQDNKTRAAELLAIWRPRLLRRMEQFGLTAGTNDT
jgi:PAS domain S-box-containing protein